MTETILPTARILVVDDEEANVDLLEQMLDRAGYTRVTGITDPRRVMPLFRDQPPDLVLLDLVMPHLDGFAVMEQLRPEIPAEAFLPILVLTADITTETRRRALAVGATDFLTKPFDHVELLLRINNLLRTRAMHLQLASQVTLLERLYEQSVEALTARSQAFAAVTHDLGQPLTAIRLATRTLQQRRPEDTDAGAELAAIELTTSRMLGMIGELLDIARLESGRALDLEYRHTDLVALVRDEVEVCRISSGRRAIDFEPLAPEILASVDPARIARVVANLLSNAVKFSPEGGPVTVTVALDAGGWARIDVQDQGLGIPAADLRLIFERFQRGGNVAGRIAGSGIGLAGARQIVEMHGGTIHVDSLEGEGSTFTVRLPLD
jgi:signal transduction histidine kinase